MVVENVFYEYLKDLSYDFLRGLKKFLIILFNFQLRYLSRNLILI